MGFPNRDLTFPEEVYDGLDIDSFYRWLTLHPKWGNLISTVSRKIREVMHMTDTIHYLDKRDDGTSYMYHPVRVAYRSLARGEFVSPDAIMTRIAHDTIEDHPKSWKLILKTIGLGRFRDVLVYATGGMKEKGDQSPNELTYREEMIHFFLKRIGRLEALLDPGYRKYIESGGSMVGNNIAQEYYNTFDIIRILNPKDPIEKAKADSRYAHNLDSQEIQRIVAAIGLYRDEIIIPKYKKDGKIFTGKDEEYISLGNYLFFTEYNCLDKLEDMLENMTDMKEREAVKPGFIKKRKIKAYILGIKLKNLGMMDEYSRLSKAFSDAGHTMLQDNEVLAQQLHRDI